MSTSAKKKILKYEKFIGGFASLMTTIMFLAIIEILLSNFRGETNIIIQPVATAISSILWLTYGYAKNDLFIIFPNIIGSVLGVVTTIAALV